MSCRETHGNSAVTSLAKFLTSAGEQSVSRVFHQLKRQSGLVLGEVASQPADRKNVVDFLTVSLNVAKSDERIRESRRESLVTRFTVAIGDARRGVNLPTKATFKAWQELEASLRAAPVVAEEPAAPVMDPSVGVTAEGLPLALGDVLAARRRAEQLRVLAMGGRANNESPANFQPFNARSMDPKGTREYLLAKEKADKLEAAYDATDVGFDLLTRAPESDPNMPGHGAWRTRMRAAKAMRKQPSDIAQYRLDAARLGEVAARQARNEALSTARSAENLVRMQDIPAHRATYDAALAEFKRAQRVWLYAVALDPAVANAAASDLTSPATWSRLTGNPQVSRFDCWRAAELVRADLDGLEVRLGRISQIAANTRPVDRAEARQHVLDSEGNGEVDPVNRRFAESVRLRRNARTAAAR